MNPSQNIPGKLRNISSLSLLLLLLAIIMAAPSGFAQSDDFYRRNDTQWNQYQPLLDSGAGASFSAGDRTYRIQAAASPDPVVLGPGRGFSLRTNVYSNFYVSVDIVDWNTGGSSPAQTMGPLARITEPGTRTSDGYCFLLESTGDVKIRRITDDGATTLSTASLTLDAGVDYRLVFSGAGSVLKGQVFNVADLTTPLVTLTATDSTYGSGYCGLLSSAIDGSTSSTDVTFDNYVANGADFTVSESLISLATSGTKNYTFLDASSGESIIVAVTMSPSFSDPLDVFTILDGDNRLAIGAPDNGGDGNWIEGSEAVNFTASLVSASSGVASNSIRFRIASLGIRPNAGMTWSSSAGLRSIGSSGEKVYALDTSSARLSSGYSGRFTVNDQTQLSDIGSWNGESIVFQAGFSAQIIAGTQVGGSPTNAVPSLEFVNEDDVVLAANFGGENLVRDSISFTGVSASSNPTIAALGQYSVTLSAPSGGISTASFGDGLFGTFAWAGIQSQMSVNIAGLNPVRSYKVYYLCGDSRSFNFDMLLAFTASNGAHTNITSGTMSWGANSATGQHYVYLPVTISGASSLDAAMVQNGGAGVGFSGVLVVDNGAATAIANTAPTLSVIGTLNGEEDAPLTVDYSALKALSNAADPQGDEISFRVESITTGTLTRDGGEVVAGSTLLNPGQVLVWTPASQVNGTVNAFTVTAWDGALSSSSPVQVAVSVDAINDEPEVLNPLPTLSVTYGDTLAYTFPTNTFFDIDSPVLTYSFEPFDDCGPVGPPGPPIPPFLLDFNEVAEDEEECPLTTPWLQFDPATRTFSGTPTNTGIFTAGLLVATDENGLAIDYVQVEVLPANLVVTPGNFTRTTGETNPFLTGTISGIKFGDNITATYITPATPSSPAGDYPVAVVLNDPDGRLVNYSVTLNEGTLRVSDGATSPVGISINFVGGKELNNPSAMSATESAGVVALTNWNSVAQFPSSSGSANDLVDSTGAATTASVSWASSVWGQEIADTPGDYRMMKGYLDPVAPTTLTISGIPPALQSSGYDVIVYSDGDASAENIRVGRFAIGETTIYAADTNGLFDGTYTRAAGVSDDGVSTSAGNYVRFSNLSLESFELSVEPGSAEDNMQRSPVNGIQIIGRSAFAPLVLENPTNQTACPGDLVLFTFKAIGNPAPAVQWQRSINDGTSFEDIEGATDDGLLFEVSGENLGSQYRAILSNALGTATTTAATLSETELTPPTINTASTVCGGSTGNIGFAPFGWGTYSWTISNGEITGSSNLPFVTYTAGTSGQVLLVLTVADGCTATNSTTVAITEVTPINEVTIIASEAGVCADSSGNQASAQVFAGVDTTDDLSGTITAQDQNIGAGEVAANAFDNDINSKWLDFATIYPTSRSSWIQYQYTPGIQRVVDQYTITSAADAPERDPSDWRILASNDGTNWTTLDTRVDEIFPDRAMTRRFSFPNATAYNIYRLQIDSVALPPFANAVQLAEIQFLTTAAPEVTYSWSIANGTITSATNQPTITYNAGSSDVELNVVVESVCSGMAIASKVVPIAHIGGGIVFNGTVCANSTNTASAAAADMTYAWNIVNGTIIGPTNQQTVTYSVGASGRVGLGMLVTNPAGCSAGDYAEVDIQPRPTASISTSSSVTADSTSNTASGPDGATTYGWTIANGTITSDPNLQTITYTAGSNGTVELGLVVANALGCTTITSTQVTITEAPIVTAPVLSSWITNSSGQYARLYTNAAAQAAGVTVSTWTYSTINGTSVVGTQSTPVYSGIQEIYSSESWVYIRSSTLPATPIGPLLAYTPAPLYLPFNQKALYRIPRSANYTSNKALTGGGAIGYLVDGVAMFDTRDALSWTGSSETMGTGYWTRDAYINEGYGFDPVQGHAAPNGAYHYHSNPQALRSALGDHVDYDPGTKTYAESTTPVTKHSPILGWVRDGYPLYGPYGYSSASNSASGIRRMVSGFVLRNGQNGTADLAVTGRTNIPAWAQRLYGVASATGPSVASYGPLGRYLEDSDHMGDLINPNTSQPFIKGVDYDLDEYNGRWCVTPEFPNGTYAYFVTINTDGTPKYPYYIGRAFFGTPAGGSISNLTETVVTNFVGGTNMPLKLGTPSRTANLVTLTWSGVDGGSYKVESTANLSAWTTLTTGASAPRAVGAYAYSTPDSSTFYKVTRTAVAPFDPVTTGTTAGGGTTSIAPGGSATRGTTVTVTITLPSSPPNPPVGAPAPTVTLGGTIAGTSVSYPSQGTVIATFAIPANATTGAQNIVVVFNPGPTYTLTGGFTINP